MRTSISTTRNTESNKLVNYGNIIEKLNKLPLCKLRHTVLNKLKASLKILTRGLKFQTTTFPRIKDYSFEQSLRKNCTPATQKHQLYII